MNLHSKKLTALALSAAIFLSIGTGAAFAAGSTAKEPPKADSKAVSAAPRPARDGHAAKDETVYVLSGADGSTSQVIVSSWLSNPDHEDLLPDVSHLDGIENVKGTESFTAGPDGELTWNAAGQDIYYQGTTEEAVPVELRISYTLDGQPISPEELAGKSGHVTIRFDYRNRQTRTVMVDGAEQEVSVPFLMLTGVMLDPAHFSRVCVTNGKSENLGNEIAVVGIALPGTQEALGVDPEKLELPGFVEISAEADHFELGPTMTIAATSLLRGLDTSALNIDDLRKQADTLTDAMNRLMDGSGQLFDGLSTLLDQTQLLVQGVDQLSTGAIQLQAGADQLYGGASRLQSGAAALSEGLGTLNGKSDSLRGGAYQVFVSLLANANTQLAAAGLEVPALTIDNYGAVLLGVIDSLDPDAVYASALQQVTDAVHAHREEFVAAVTEVVREQVEAQVRVKVIEGAREQVREQVLELEDLIRLTVIRDAVGMSPIEYELALKAGKITEEQQAAVEAALEAAIDAEVEKQMQTEKVQSLIDSTTAENTEQQMQTGEVQAIIEENTELQMEKRIADTMASPEIQDKLSAAAEGAKSIISLKSSLDSYRVFYQGVLAYTEGVDTAAAGSKELIAGASTLKDGMQTLNSGACELSGGMQAMKGKTPELMSGIAALRDGSKALRDGLTQLMEEGISRLTDLASEDLEPLLRNLTASVDAANAYRTFSGAPEGIESTVKFVYKTASITTD